MHVSYGFLLLLVSQCGHVSYGFLLLLVSQCVHVSYDFLLLLVSQDVYVPMYIYNSKYARAKLYTCHKMSLWACPNISCTNMSMSPKFAWSYICVSKCVHFKMCVCHYVCMSHSVCFPMCDRPILLVPMCVFNCRFMNVRVPICYASECCLFVFP